MTHDLKTYSPNFKAIWGGSKHFETRKNEPGYQINDVVILKEFELKGSAYTGRIIEAKITYIQQGNDYGIMSGYVVIGFKIIKRLKKVK